MNWLPWSPLFAAGLHIVEEFVFPGHFSEWYKVYKPGFERSITPRFLVIMNTLLLILCYDAGALAERPAGILIWFCAVGILSANGIWHLVGVAKTHRYSPGVATGILLYIPLALYGGFHFLYDEHSAIVPAVASFALGTSYQLWGNILHRARAKHSAV